MKNLLTLLYGTAAVGIAVLAGCSTKTDTAPKPTEAVGRNFRVAVPAGFDISTDAKVVPTDGVALVGTWRSEGAVPSIVVVPLPSPWTGADASTSEGCAEVSKQMAAEAPGMRLVRHEAVKAGTAPACQWELTLDGSKRGAIFTFVPQGDRGWVVTCNLGLEDQRAVTACGEVLASWKHKAAQ